MPIIELVDESNDTDHSGHDTGDTGSDIEEEELELWRTLRKTDSDYNKRNKSTQWKSPSNMDKTELEKYKHGPETELCKHVCNAADEGDFMVLNDYLQLLHDTDPDKINEKDKAGMTALHFAVSSKCLDAVKLLLKYGAKIDEQDILGFTPLFFATGRYASYELSKYLLENGKASVHLRTRTWASTLHGAALQGDIDCVRLLLQYGADPRNEDEDGTTPFDLAKDDATRAILHDALIELDAKRDTIDAVCAQCKLMPKAGLKRCGQCHVTMYCSRECQVKHWREGGHRSLCLGFVIARPFHLGEHEGQGLQTSFYRVMGSDKSNVKVFMRKADEAAKRMEFLRNRRFVVKVQLPIGQPDGEMMVYNADRSVEGYVYPTELGYDELAKRVKSEGFMGVKAFFWSELSDQSGGLFKIFHGKCAPYQQW